MTNGVGMRHASFSRDGTKLAYSQGRRVSNVWRVPLLEERVATWGDAEQVTFDQAFIEFLDVSPDDSWVVISSDRGGNQDLWKFPAAGGEMIQMTSDPATDLGPVWSPNGEEIAFYSTRTGLRQQFIVPSEGGAARRVLTSEASDWSGRWSADGERFVFGSDRSGNLDVWIVGTDGTDARQITTHAGRDMMPVWAPTGDEIIFTSERNGPRSLYRMPVDGGEPKSISAIPASYARWSRDGQTLYWIEFGAASGNIWAVSPRTGTERRMTDLERKGGNLGTYGLAVTDSHLYFTWEEDRGDIWVMDVVTDETE